jgi:hypothetical protein
MVKHLLILSALWMMAGVNAFAENVNDPEIENSVPELIAFHEVIYPMWHDAYPAKDVEALKGFVPKINELSAQIYKVRLPGILHESESKWKVGVSNLRKSVKAYNAASKKTDAQAMLAAAEELHKRHEMLVRVIRPVLPEMDAFHKVLYIVYHKDLPAEQWEGIRKKAPELYTNAKAVTEASLPKRFEARGTEFKNAADALAKAVSGLQELGVNAAGSETKKAVLNIHNKYLALQKVFE